MEVLEHKLSSEPQINAADISQVGLGLPRAGGPARS